MDIRLCLVYIVHILGHKYSARTAYCALSTAHSACCAQAQCAVLKYSVVYFEYDINRIVGDTNVLG